MHSTNLRIVLVEDQETALVALGELLAQNGFEVALASDGEEALALVEAFAPDAVVMDLGLPRVNGWEATLRLRRDRARARMPIVAVTGQPRAEAAAIGREVGCSEVFTKPVDIDLLTRRLRELIAEAAAGGEIAIPAEGC